MPFKLIPARHAFPDILVLNSIAVFRSNFHTSIPERETGLAAPGFEGRAVRVIAHFVDHEGGEVAEFMREDVVETCFVVDYFGGEFDGAVVAGGGCVGGGFAGVPDADCFAAPVGAAGCCF